MWSHYKSVGKVSECCTRRSMTASKGRALHIRSRQKHCPHSTSSTKVIVQQYQWEVWQRPHWCLQYAFREHMHSTLLSNKSVQVNIFYIRSSSGYGHLMHTSSIMNFMMMNDVAFHDISWYQQLNDSVHEACIAIVRQCDDILVTRLEYITTQMQH